MDSAVTFTTVVHRLDMFQESYTCTKGVVRNRETKEKHCKRPSSKKARQIPHDSRPKLMGVCC